MRTGPVELRLAALAVGVLLLPFAARNLWNVLLGVGAIRFEGWLPALTMLSALVQMLSGGADCSVVAGRCTVAVPSGTVPAGFAGTDLDSATAGVVGPGRGGVHRARVSLHLRHDHHGTVGLGSAANPGSGRRCDSAQRVADVGPEPPVSAADGRRIRCAMGGVALPSGPHARSSHSSNWRCAASAASLIFHAVRSRRPVKLLMPRISPMGIS